MSGYLERMKAEAAALEEKVVALAAFVAGNPVFKTLPVQKQFLMSEQLDAMNLYLETLELRIALEGAQ